MCDCVLRTRYSFGGMQHLTMSSSSSLHPAKVSLSYLRSRAANLRFLGPILRGAAPVSLDGLACACRGPRALATWGSKDAMPGRAPEVGGRTGDAARPRERVVGRHQPEVFFPRVPACLPLGPGWMWSRGETARCHPRNLKRVRSISACCGVAGR